LAKQSPDVQVMPKIYL